MRGQALRDHVLTTATGLFVRDGFRATGVDAVVAAAGIAKRSLYNHFGAKETLVAEVLRRRHDAFAGRIRDALAARAEAPADRILAWFDVLGEELADPAYRGCLFFNAALEVGDAAEVRAVIDENNAFTHGLLVELLTEAGAAEPEPAARELGVVRRGAQMTAAVTGRAEAIAEAKRVAARVLSAHGVGRTEGGKPTKKRKPRPKKQQTGLMTLRTAGVKQTDKSTPRDPRCPEPPPSPAPPPSSSEPP